MSGLSKSVPASTTPILDSAVLPGRARRWKFSQVFFGFALGGVGGWYIASALEGESYGMKPAYVLLSFVAAFFFAVAVHELGHLVAGRLVGFHFSFVQIGPLSLRLEYGRFKVRVHRGITLGGFAGIQANRVSRLRRRLIIFIMGGPGANLLSIPATVVLVNYAFPSLGRNWVAVPAAQFAFISLLLVLTSFSLKGGTSDGARIWMLLSSSDSARRWMSIFALGLQAKKGVPARSWKRSWISAASRLRDGSRDEFVGNWFAYASANDSKDSARAAIHLERCLELVTLVRPSLLSLAIVEAAVFVAWFRNDALTADKWARKVKHPKQGPPLPRIRLQTALLCSRADFDAALISWQEGQTWIENLPATPSNDRLRDSWLEWKEEIHERQNQNVAI